MGKKQKKTAVVQHFEKRKEEDRSSSPFSSIVLREKSPKAAVSRPKVSSERKKPSEIVQGFNPGDSFADILESFERTGNPYGMPKKGKDHGKEAKMDFAAILEKWENRGKPRPDPPDRKRSSYNATRSFGSILDEFENGDRTGRTPAGRKAVKPVEEAPAEDAAAPQPEDEPSSDLFRKADGDSSRSPDASWSIYGGNDSFVRKERLAGDGAKTVPDGASSGAAYQPSVPFSEILSSYYKDAATTSVCDDSHAGRRPKTFEQILREKGDDEKRSRNHTLSELRTMLPQATLDLHGMKQEECESAVEQFLADARRNGLRKISIITGKGLHSDNGVPVLREVAVRVLGRSGIVSEQSRAPLNHGGSGAIWIILKKE